MNAVLPGSFNRMFASVSRVVSLIVDLCTAALTTVLVLTFTWDPWRVSPLAVLTLCCAGFDLSTLGLLRRR